MEKRPRYRLSVDHYEKMIQHGILTENDNVELIRGELVTKMAIGDPHSSCLKQVTRLFYSCAMNLTTMGVQDPILLIDSEPEPDFTVLVPRKDNYRIGKPKPADIYLVVEVADSSLEYDRDVKGPLYAENGIAEYWIVNLIDQCVEVHRDPQPDGTFGETAVLKPGESITLALLPTVSIAVADIFG